MKSPDQRPVTPLQLGILGLLVGILFGSVLLPKDFSSTTLGNVGLGVWKRYEKLRKEFDQNIVDGPEYSVWKKFLRY